MNEEKFELSQVWTQEDIDLCVECCREFAITDMAYRQRLIENPYQAILEQTGKTIPPGVKIRVIENDPGYDYTFLLPDLVSSFLEDGMMDDVVGGGCAYCQNLSANNCQNFSVCNNNCGKQH